ncbi:hypothetical protein K2Z84_21155 [Candidatus Binatia bacterium]|nr:hypothetical protein [Candidatus Binatia bacterium]
MTIPFESYFFTIANVAIVLGGFTAVTGVFRRESVDGWLPQEMAGIRFMFEHMLAACGIPVVLIPMLEILGDEAHVWRAASALLLAFLAFELILNGCRVVRLRAAGTPPRHPIALYFVFFPGTAAASLLQLWGIWRPGPRSLLWGLVWLLVSIAIQFHHFLFPRRAVIAAPPSGPRPLATSKRLALMDSRTLRFGVVVDAVLLVIAVGLWRAELFPEMRDYSVIAAAILLPETLLRAVHSFSRGHVHVALRLRDEGLMALQKKLAGGGHLPERDEFQIIRLAQNSLATLGILIAATFVLVTIPWPLLATVGSSLTVSRPAMVLYACSGLLDFVILIVSLSLAFSTLAPGVAQDILVQAAQRFYFLLIYGLSFLGITLIYGLWLFFGGQKAHLLASSLVLFCSLLVIYCGAFVYFPQRLVAAQQVNGPDASRP